MDDGDATRNGALVQRLPDDRGRTWMDKSPVGHVSTDAKLPGRKFLLARRGHRAPGRAVIPTVVCMQPLLYAVSPLRGRSPAMAQLLRLEPSDQAKKARRPVVRDLEHRRRRPAARRPVACFLHERFPGIQAVLGRGQRMLAGSDHPTGLAIDLFVGRNKTLGDQIASCAARNFDDWNETEGDCYAARNPDPARVDGRRPL